MSHHTTTPHFVKLADRLNQLPQGAPPSDLLFKILKTLFTEKEAGLVALLPISPFNAETAAKIWRMPVSESVKILDDLASRAILVDMESNDEITYCLPPPMAGFFEFSLMRMGRKDIDQKALSELFYQYLNVEEEFVTDLFLENETQIGRVFVNEPALQEDNLAYVLDYERASEAIRQSSYMAVGTCYCRHKMFHVEKACDAPLNDICMTFGSVARSLSRHNHAKRIDKAEGLDLLRKAYEHNLVQYGSNERKDVSFICNCCGCCCEALTAYRKASGILPSSCTTNFLPRVEKDFCKGCGKCVNVCPMESMTLVSANAPNAPKKKKAKLDENMCLGCGICVRVCPEKVISLVPRTKRVITPVNIFHRYVVMAIERGKLQNLIFDKQALWYHRIMAAILGVILKLPPVKQIMASEQMKSRYLDKLLERY